MAKNDDAGDRKPTVCVILKRERVIVLGDGVDDETIKAVQKMIREKDKRSPSGVAADAWCEAARVTADTKDKAITAHAGEPNTPVAVPGTYKAVPVTNWKGGRVYERPEQPKVEARPLDE